LAQHIVMLRHSRRFGSGSGIGRLARAVNLGDAQAARTTLASGAGDLHVLRLSGEQDRALERLLIGGLGEAEPRPQGYAHYLQLMQAQRPEPDAGEQAWDDWAGRVLA